MKWSMRRASAMTSIRPANSDRRLHCAGQRALREAPPDKPDPDEPDPEPEVPVVEASPPPLAAPPLDPAEPPVFARDPEVVVDFSLETELRDLTLVDEVDTSLSTGRRTVVRVVVEEPLTTTPGRRFFLTMVTLLDVPLV